MDAEAAPEAVFFRPAKRRKFQRDRASSDQEDVTNLEDQEVTGVRNAESSGGKGSNVAEVFRVRKANRAHPGGIAFSSSKLDGKNSESGDVSMTLALTRPEQPSVGTSISDRFVGHAGQVADVNKQMVAYIDSQMAKHHAGTQHTGTTNTNTDDIEEPTSDSDEHEHRNRQRNPAALGKIDEINLGTDASTKNTERTEDYLRRVRDGEALPDPDQKPPKKRKPRIGRDGKPYIPRPRRGPDPEDVKRDQLVEAVLRESGLGMYDAAVPASTGDTVPAAGDEDADERLAEQFRQEYLDAMEARRQNAPKMPASKGAGADVQRGPKLGGSRSARAAMRERELAEAAAKGKK